MKTKRKISVRKILQVLLTITAATCCIIAMVSASSIEGEKPLKALPVVHIKNDRKYQFIEQKKIMDLAIYNRNIDILHTPVSKLELRGIERAIKSDPWVADAQVFVDIDRVMHIYVTQRVPVARIFRRDGTSYYMDSTLHTMPLSESYTYYTMVVTNAPDMGNDSAGVGLRKQITTLVRTISADSFWNAQIAQVIIDSAGTFELMPVLGNQKILFGDTSSMNEKFSTLMAFYKNVLNRIGWDKYETLDVRFHGQVIAAPSLPYKGPLDKAIAKMNWITSIEVTEAQKTHEDSVRAAETKVAAIAAAAVKTAAIAKAKAEALAAAKAEAKKAAAKASHGVAAKHVEKVAVQQKKAVKPVSKVAAKPTPKAKTVAGNSKSGSVKKQDAKKNVKAVAEKKAKGNTVAGHAAGKSNTKAIAKSKDTKPGKKGGAVAHPAAKANVKKIPAATMKSHLKEDRKKHNAKDVGGKDKKKNEQAKKANTGAAKYTYPAEKGH